MWKVVLPIHNWEISFLLPCLELVECQVNGSGLILLSEEKCKVIYFRNYNSLWNYFLKEDWICKEWKKFKSNIWFIIKISDHVSVVVYKVNSKLVLIKRTIIYLNKESLIQTYKSFVRFILKYLSVIWNPMLRMDSEKILRGERRFLKMLRSTEQNSCIECLKEMYLTTLT